MQNLLNIDKSRVSGKTVLLRVDLNVPFRNGNVEDNTRIRKIIPTIKHLQNADAKVVVLSHFDRPKGKFVKEMSLDPIAKELGRLLQQEVKFAPDCIGELAEAAVRELKQVEVLVLENLRFHKGEEDNDPNFSRSLASLGDIYINDTFSCSHRAHASIVGITEYLPSYAGLLLSEELSNIETILNTPKKPIVAFVGGSKISTKLDLLSTLVKKVDLLAIGGAMANNFLLAEGYNIGKSLYEEDYIVNAQNILAIAEEHNCEIILPIDVVAAKNIDSTDTHVVDVESIDSNEMALDIGPNTVELLCHKLEGIKTLVWNGPMGAFEFKPFAEGTASLARHVVELTKNSQLTSIAGGGDIVAALTSNNLHSGFSYISTAGGAFLEWLEGKELPGIAALNKCQK
jgi:phosphoglycerate kinase